MRVSRISLGGGGWACAVRAATVRNASAAMARVAHRTRSSSSVPGAHQGGQALAGGEVLFHRPLAPGGLDQVSQRHPARGVAAVVGQLAGAPVAAEQQVPVPGQAGVDRYPGPVVVAGGPWHRGPANSRSKARGGSFLASASAGRTPAAVVVAI